MQQHFLDSLTSRPTGRPTGDTARPAGEAAGRSEGPAGEAPSAAAAGLEFEALVDPSEAPADPAPQPAGERAVTDPDDPLAALVSAFLPDKADATDAVFLPDWLRAALLGSAVPGLASGAEEVGAGGSGPAGTTGTSAGPEGDGGDAAGVARIGRAEGVAVLAVADGAVPAGGLSSGELPDGDDAGMPPIGVSSTIGAGPEDGSTVAAGDRISGHPARDAGEAALAAAANAAAPLVAATNDAATIAGATNAAAATTNAAADAAAAGPAPGRTVDGGRGRGRIDPSDPAAKGSGLAPGPATAEGPAALRVPSGAELRDAPAQGLAARSMPTGAEVAAATVPPKGADLADPRIAAFDPAGMDRAAARVPPPDPAAPSPAVGATDALTAAVEAPRPATPQQPVALPQLRDAMAERVRTMAEDAGNETVRVRSATGTSEVELAPAELGRLRLQLSTTERGLHLTVIVDRPESIDAVRRHLDGLHRSLMAEGLTLDGFDIGTGGKGQEQAAGQGRGGQETPGRASGRADAHTPPAAPETPPSPSPAPGRSATGRLDIRI